MAEAAVSFFIQTLGGILIQEFQILSGVHENVAWIKDELQSMKAYLKDADRRRDKEEGVEAWVSQVRRLVFDAEDAIDEFIIKMEQQRHLRNATCMGCITYHACFIKNLMVRHQFSAKIRRIQRAVKEIDERRNRYNFLATVEAESSNAMDSGHGDPGVASPFIEEADIIGIDNYVTQLWSFVNTDTQQRMIISIVGMGGLGKTTLAKEVYKIMKQNFECHAWIFVSQSFLMKDILRKMVEGFYKSREDSVPSGMEKMDESELQYLIYNYLRGKRYAVVLDDIWTIHAWDGLKHALPLEGRGRIIFTTRNESAAFPADEMCYMFKLQPLPYELAWDLFCKKAFRNHHPQGSCPQHLADVVGAIVRRCEGLPLAIVVIGGLMSKRSTSPSEWTDVLQNLDWELGHNQDLTRLDQVLLTSYNYLPANLKYCFLYCGLFPEDYSISRKRLIRLWTAEGFIEEHPRKTQEEVADKYFLELIQRSMLQPVFGSLSWELKACRMHDLMRDVAIHMFKREDFGLVVTDENTTYTEKQRRLAIQKNVSTVSSNTNELNLRSLLMFGWRFIPASPFTQMLVDFKLLRVMDIEGTLIQNLPEEVGALIHLRYLSLEGTFITNLPISFRRLHALQTLNVRDTEVKRFPSGAMLLQLRHVLLNEEIITDLSSTNFSNLAQLQTLSGASADEMLVKQLCYLTKLRKLFIVRIRTPYCRQLCDSISLMTRLRSLKLKSLHHEEIQLETLSPPPLYLEKLKLNGYMKKLPDWLGSLSSLYRITLRHSGLMEDPLNILKQLPNLLILHLHDVFMGKRMGCGPGGFPKLVCLRIANMEQLEEWSTIEPGTFQSLQSLTILDCPNLQMLPQGLQHLTALRRLLLIQMPEGFIGGLEKGEESRKIQHIPYVQYYNPD